MVELHRPLVATKKVIIIETEVYSRVVGYYRPVKNWNAGKKAEHEARKPFTLQLDGREISR